MHSHHRRNLTIALAYLFDETLVFRNPPTGDVAVGDFITDRGTDSRLSHGTFNQVKRAIPHCRGGMVVNDRGCAIADTVNQRPLCREGDVLFMKCPGPFPPPSA